MFQTEIYKQSLQLAEKSYQEKETDLKARLSQLQKDLECEQRAKEQEVNEFKLKVVSQFTFSV